MLYLQLFLSFAKIGLFGFGGGLAILSLIQHEVETYGWMSQAEFGILWQSVRLLPVLSVSTAPRMWAIPPLAACGVVCWLRLPLSFRA